MTNQYYVAGYSDALVKLGFLGFGNPGKNVKSMQEFNFEGLPPEPSPALDKFKQQFYQQKAPTPRPSLNLASAQGVSASPAAAGGGGILSRIKNIGTKGKLGLGLGAAALVGGGAYLKHRANQNAAQGQAQQFYGAPQMTYGGSY